MKLTYLSNTKELENIKRVPSVLMNQKCFNIRYYVKIIVCSIIFLISINIFAQISSGGVPISLIDRSLLANKSSQNTYHLPYVNNELARQYADSVSGITQQNFYYGKGLDIEIDIKQQDQLIEYNNTNNGFNDSGKVWLLFIESLSAYGMQFYFNEYKLPDGARLYIFNEDKTMLLGSFTSYNNPENEELDIKFVTQPISGNNIIIEYFEPNNAEFEGELSIVNVIHVFDNIFEKSGTYGTSAPCNIDVACPIGIGWENENKSVALVLYYDAQNELAAQCSGALINNTEENGRPYFLSANHCADGIGLPYDYSTWVFLFNHEMLSCDGSIYNYGNSTYGSTLLANGTISDYLLIELNTSSDILASYGVCFAGWTLTDNPQGSFVGIHHPAGDVKKISGANNIINYSNNHWHIDWVYGSTQGGSSGSPLFENNHRIIGQVHYGINPDGNVCHPDKITGYGKFKTSWNDGNLSFWLDPYNTGQVSTNSYCPVGSGGGSGGSSGGLYHCVTNLQEDGFYINGEGTTEVIEVCLDEPIIISPPFPHSIWPDKCNKTIFPWLVITKRGKCNDLQNEYPFYCTNVPFTLGIKCDCKFKLLHISINECDYNKNLIGSEYHEWKAFTVQEQSFNLLEFLPSGSTITQNKYYKIKISSMYNHFNGSSYSGWHWNEATRYIHTYSDNMMLDGYINPTMNIYGENITIKNTTITYPIEVVASSSIKISEGTNIKAGHCYIDEQIGCFSFVNKSMVYANTSFSSNNSVNRHIDFIEREITHFAFENEYNKVFQVHPNPFDNSFIVSLNLLEKSDVKIYLTNTYGRKVMQIHNGQIDTGYYSIEVSTHSLPTGMYFCVFETPTQREVVKIVKIE